jgi:hypothetical protein
MADEKDDKWVMPTPVFRSTPGALPKSLQKTISGYNLPKQRAVAPEADDDILSIMDEPAEVQTEPSPSIVPKLAPAAPPKDDADGTPEEAESNTTAGVPTVDPIKVIAAPIKQQRKGGAGSFIVIFLLVAALAAGLVYAIIYYLSHRPGSTGPF